MEIFKTVVLLVYIFILFLSCNKKVEDEKVNNKIPAITIDSNKTKIDLVEFDSFPLKNMNQFLLKEYNISESIIKKEICGNKYSLISAQGFNYKSKVAIRKTESGKIYKRFNIKYMYFDSIENAVEAIKNCYYKSNVDTGLSYKYDYVIQKANIIYWLNADCVFSNQNWKKLKELINNSLRINHEMDSKINYINCECGTGCSFLNND